MEQYLIESYCATKDIILLRQIESFYESENPWTEELRGKKVLIVSPFVELIKEQYEKRDLVWAGKNVLPEMELRFLKSVWYLGKEENSGFEDWFAALEYLYSETLKIDFDIALLGCGPFGSFLAARLKRAGKQAIQYGGSLQILFGIRGARWDNYSGYTGYYNEYWVRPSKEDGPRDKRPLDDGCYW
jgi:hypothetical protein